MVPDVGAPVRRVGDGVVCSAQSSNVCRSGAVLTADVVETADSERETNHEMPRYVT